MEGYDLLNLTSFRINTVAYILLEWFVFLI
jgi:hypothetical protein